MDVKNDYPVVNVNLNDALTFCAWMSENSGTKVNLPNEKRPYRQFFPVKN